MTQNTRNQPIPADLLKALQASPEVLALWHDLTPLARRDWTSWIDAAKKAETRARRIEQTGSKLLAGKRRPCCYAVVPMNLYKLWGKIRRRRQRGVLSRVMSVATSLPG